VSGHIGSLIEEETRKMNTKRKAVKAALTAALSVCLAGCGVSADGKKTIRIGHNQAISAALSGITDNKYIILLIMNVILLIAGTFMDVTPAILIFTPLFLPIVKTFGMSPIQFGLILVCNLCI